MGTLIILSNQYRITVILTERIVSPLAPDILMDQLDAPSQGFNMADTQIFAQKNKVFIRRL